MDRMLSYGDHDDQVVELLEPAGTSRGLAVLVHGGYWRRRFTRELMAPLAEDLLRRGWTVGNVEYRRGGDGGGWPASLLDARTAMALLANEVRRRALPTPVVGVGHSVGGQLVLLGADHVDAVVALAPVTDLARTRAEGLGEDAVREILPEPPDVAPRPYEEGSPLHQVPPARPVLVVHGDQDTRVPLAHSEDYARRASGAGGDVELRVVPGLDHLGLIDPRAPHWEGVVAWMEACRS